MVQPKIQSFYKITDKYNLIFVIICLSKIIAISDCASVRTADSKIYIVTPEPGQPSEARYIPYFVPTPVPDDGGEVKDDDNKRFEHEDKHQDTPDIIMAEFKPGNGKPNERMISVKEMLSQEKIATYTTAKNTQEVTVKGKVEDVWDIIKHNQNLEATTKRNIPENSMSSYKTNNMPKATDILISPSVESEFHDVSQSSETKPMSSYKAKSKNEPKVTEILVSPSIDSQYSYETKGNVNTLSVDNNAWSNSKPNSELQSSIDKVHRDSDNIANVDEPRTIRGNENSWDFPDSRKPSKVNFYTGYENYDTGYANLDTSKYDYIAPGEAQDRYNPAQPYLPPKPPAPMPPPPVQMPPPPPPASMPPPPPPKPPTPPEPKPSPPKEVMSPPSLSFDAIPPYPSHDDSKPPDSAEYSYLPPGDSDKFPQFIYDDHHHHHHDDEDLYFYHHPPPPPPPPPMTTTTTTTAAPEKRNTNRFSYYYLGKKLWYLPLYFSVYFIIYVGSLIIKSIARHKITYPQHYKNKRALDGMLSEETIDNLSRLASNAIVKMAEKYFDSKS